MNAVLLRTHRRGPTRKRPKRLGADKAFSNHRIRRWCHDRGIRASIALPKDQREYALRRRGRLPFFDREVYRGRNIIERLNGWIKHCRAVVTRFDQYARNYLGMVLLAFLRRLVRRYFSDAT
jgi:transposase